MRRLCARSFASSRRRLATTATKTATDMVGLSRLSLQIESFAQNSALSDEDMELRHSIVDKHIKGCITKALGTHCEVQLFGSTVTGLALVDSDIDVLVSSALSKHSSAGKPLNQVRRQLQRQKLVAAGPMEVIPSARVPLIKFVAKGTNVKVDLAFEREPGSAITSDLQSKQLKRCPAAAPLILVLKAFLRQRSANNAVTGGIGSYLLFWMVMSTIPKRAPAGSDALGQLLVQFFLAWSEPHHSTRALAGLVDPSSGRPLAKAVHRFAALRLEFAAAAARLLDTRCLSVLLERWPTNGSAACEAISRAEVAEVLGVAGRRSPDNVARRRKKRRSTDAAAAATVAGAPLEDLTIVKPPKATPTASGKRAKRASAKRRRRAMRRAAARGGAAREQDG